MTDFSQLPRDKLDDLRVMRHGRELRFVREGLSETPYVYQPMTKRGLLYEEPFLEHIRDLGRVGQYVDVGAHLGTHTVWFAALCPATHVHSFEPVARYANVAQANVEANGLTSRVTLHRVGLGAEPGSATNYLSPEHQVGFTAERAGVTEEFPVVRLDDVVSGPVSLLKLDVEGMESQVLAGATRILSRYRPVVYAEARKPAVARELAKQLSRYGYRPTGRVFNSSPTHEYAAPPFKGAERLRPLYVRLPPQVRRLLRRR